MFMIIIRGIVLVLWSNILHCAKLKINEAHIQGGGGPGYPVTLLIRLMLPCYLTIFHNVTYKSNFIVTLLPAKYAKCYLKFIV